MPTDPGDFRSRLRQLALQRLDHEVLTQIQSSPADIRFGAEDLRVLASLLREARKQLEEILLRNSRVRGPARGLTLLQLIDLASTWSLEADALVETVATALDNSEPPTKPSNAPPFREFFLAAIEWYSLLYRTRQARRFEPTIIAFSRFDMSAMPDLRERLAVELADIGRRSSLPDELEQFVRWLAERPYLLSSAAALRILGLTLHRGIAEAPEFDVADEWLPHWLHHLSRASFLMDRQRMLLLKDDIHARLSLLMSARNIIRGRFGGLGTAVVLLTIKMDYSLFIKLKLSRSRIGLRWLSWMQLIARKLTKLRRVSGNRNDPSPARGTPGGLAVLNATRVVGSRYDMIVTRAQGGYGDILTMRPGLIEAARRARSGRVVFATSHEFFPVFSIDDPVDLVDINSAEIDVRSFGRWSNLTDCPGARVETAQMPKIRSNRVDIFARAMGVRFPRRNRIRVYPIKFDDSVEHLAKELVYGRAPSGIRIGIQLRSAESYKDVPAMLEAARTLAKKYNVFLFDSRPIPRRADDRFICVDDQPIRTALAMIQLMDALLTPDSSFMHVAGSSNVPCLALFGSADGKVRCRPYPSVRFLDARQHLACIPCWRNEVEKCRLGDGYTSICLNFLTAPLIVAAMEEMLAVGRRSPA